jgi:hypothetical protein
MVLVLALVPALMVLALALVLALEMASTALMAVQKVVIPVEMPESQVLLSAPVVAILAVHLCYYFHRHYELPLPTEALTLQQAQQASARL